MTHEIAPPRRDYWKTYYLAHDKEICARQRTYAKTPNGRAMLRRHYYKDYWNNREAIIIARRLRIARAEARELLASGKVSPPKQRGSYKPRTLKKN